MTTPFVLKERLQTLIGDSQVKAALFYTFNFDAAFFENYLLPLLLPQQQFLNNPIANNIIWRRLYKDGVVPPVTVYCDQYAKSLEKGPSLPYDIVEVNMPSLGRNKGNFHPKQSFILLERDGRQELIILTGSNNITQGGWCENKECVSELVLINTQVYPYTFKKAVQTFIRQVREQYSGSPTESEALIERFLNGIGYTKEKNYTFYDSFQGPFQQFLEAHIFSGDTIKEVEIISPYFIQNTQLIDYLQEKGVAVKIEAPYRGEYCLMEEALFHQYAEKGVRWYYPKDDRMVHSKVYRFYSAGSVYTVIGSVNFTAPAWAGVPERRVREVYNIESALLFTEKMDKIQRMLGTEITAPVRFLPAALANEEDNALFERCNAPSIFFTLDWASGVLEWRAKLTHPTRLCLTPTLFFDLSSRGAIDIRSLSQSSALLDSLSRHSILEVRETVGTEERIHHYFFQQLNFEQRTLEFRLSASDILDAWQLLGSEEEKELGDWLLNRLEVYTDVALNDSGIITEVVNPVRSLLNEMAQHFLGLVKLEKFLFNPRVLQLSGKQKELHGNHLRYYLTHDNVDTLMSYLRDLQKLYEEEKLIGGYYWLLLSLLRTRFYEHPALEKLIRACVADEHRKTLRSKVRSLTEELQGAQDALEKTHPVDKKKLKWAFETLNLNYANA